VNFAELSDLAVEMTVIWVIDSSALIDFKMIVPIGEQWEFFRTLDDLVDNSMIAMPRQVIREVGEITHPDVPGAWASSVRKGMVMETAGDVVDASKDEEDADPYVLALALQLQSIGYEVRVVTSDVVDRIPIRISLETACHRMSVRTLSPEDFVVAIRAESP
jgi:hypothetical protein